MIPQNKIQLFEQKQVRPVWDDDAEKWYVSMVNMIGVPIENPDPRNCRKVLKHRLKAEGNGSVTICNRLKLQSSDGKKRLLR